MERLNGLKKVNIAVFISGTGSNLLNLIKYSKLKIQNILLDMFFLTKKMLVD